MAYIEICNIFARKISFMDKIIGIGNALVDALALVDNESILKEIGLYKGGMQLIGPDMLASINEKFANTPRRITTGGAACNTMMALAQLDMKPGVVGMIGRDRFGTLFKQSFIEAGADVRLQECDLPTGVASTFITPDGQRTFGTCLGAAGNMKPEDLTDDIFKGYDILFVEGYLALDGLAALAFGIVVITSIRNMGVKSDTGVARYTLLSGVFAGLGLAVVYLMLAYVGAQTSGEGFSFSNGGELLAAVVDMQMGKAGNIVLGLAVLMACLTTAIGLATSFADYISELRPAWSYKKVLAAVCLFSFAVSNIGLTTMISITLPALVMIYPPVVVLVLMTFLKKFINGKKEAYVLAMVMAFIVGIFDGLKNAGITEGAAFDFMSEYIPFFDLGVGWVIPAIVGAVIGMLPFIRFMNHEKKER